MNRVLRIKGISNAIGIRRSIVTYEQVIDGDYILSDKEYPLKNLKYRLEIRNHKIYLVFNEERVELLDGVSHSFTLSRKVKTLKGYELEHLEYIFVLIPLDKEAISFYEDSINKGYIFDEKKGEFDYLIGLIYQYEGNIELSREYLNKAKEQGFI